MVHTTVRLASASFKAKHLGVETATVGVNQISSAQSFRVVLIGIFIFGNLSLLSVLYLFQHGLPSFLDHLLLSGVFEHIQI